MPDYCAIAVVPMAGLSATRTFKQVAANDGIESYAVTRKSTSDVTTSDDCANMVSQPVIVHVRSSYTEVIFDE